MLKKPKKIKSSKRLNCNVYSLAKFETEERGIRNFPYFYKRPSLLRHYYGNLKRHQYNRYLKKSKSIDQLVSFLELRLDVVLFRIMFTSSIFTAKQLINHGHILVNGQKVIKPSYRIKLGDFIQIDPKIPQNIAERRKNNILPTKNWEINWKLAAATLVQLPNQDNIYYPIPINLEELGSVV